MRRSQACTCMSMVSTEHLRGYEASSNDKRRTCRWCERTRCSSRPSIIAVTGDKGDGAQRRTVVERGVRHSALCDRRAERTAGRGGMCIGEGHAQEGTPQRHRSVTTMSQPTVQTTCGLGRGLHAARSPGTASALPSLEDGVRGASVVLTSAERTCVPLVLHSHRVSRLWGAERRMYGSRKGALMAGDLECARRKRHKTVTSASS
jgi:hypothetical protein